MFINRWVDKQNVLYGMSSAFKRKEILTYAVTQMNLEDILLSKMCQSQKDKYCNTVCFHLWELPRLVKFIELESRVVVTRGSGEQVEKGMAPHSSTPAWRIPWTEGSCRLQSVGLLRVGHNWATSLSLSTFMHWRRKWQPTPIFLPGEPQGQRSLVGYHLWGRKTEVT